MNKTTWKTISALTLTVGLLLQSVSVAYAAGGDWLIEEAGEVLREENWSEDYGASDETCEVEYSDDTENEVQGGRPC